MEGRSNATWLVLLVAAVVVLCSPELATASYYVHELRQRLVRRQGLLSRHHGKAERYVIGRDKRQRQRDIDQREHGYLHTVPLRGDGAVLGRALRGRTCKPAHMHGTVWVWDIYHDSYKAAPNDGSAWTDGEGTGS